MEKKYYDANGVEFTPTEESFKLVQSNTRIHDKKFETKPTTFAKDAFKRFCKNKSSVVAAVIIALLMLCSIALPILIPHDISQPILEQSLLRPKLFETGTGFWDGTEEYHDIIYDRDAETPVGFEKNGVYKVLEFKDGTYINLPNAGAYGGYLKLVAETVNEKDNPYDYIKFFENYTKFDVTKDGGYQAVVSIADMNEILTEYAQAGSEMDFNNLATYRVSVLFDVKEENQKKTKLIPLTITTTDDAAAGLSDGWTKSTYEDITIDLSGYVDEFGEDGVLKNVGIRIEMLPTVSTEHFLMLDEIIITANDSVSEEEKDLLSVISFSNRINADKTHVYHSSVNDICLYNADSSGKFPIEYWRSSARRDLFHAKIDLISFIYDKYEAKLGNVNMIVGGTDIKTYEKNGWIKFDWNSEGWEIEYDENGNAINLDSCPIEILDLENSPIKSVTKVTVGEFLGSKSISVEGTVKKYQYMGYDEMPKYLLGTTEDGKDIIKLAFTSLRTSLLLAICVSAFCLMFGLCWGAISGYFGGNIDLIMERITDILSGVPYIVVMTLAILLFKNNIFTFGLALCFTSWIGPAARTRTQFYRFKGREYVLASRTLGASDARLIFRHILPNALGTIVTSSVLMIPGVIFSESTLAYLNLGLKGVESFGVLLSTNQRFISTYPALIVFPSIIISLLMISFNLFGNGLRDALNPSLKGSE